MRGLDWGARRTINHLPVSACCGSAMEFHTVTSCLAYYAVCMRVDVTGRVHGSSHMEREQAALM